MKNQMSRRFALSAFASLTTLLLLPQIVAAEYPEGPIQIIVPASPGGDTDFNARVLGKYLSEELDISIPIVNMPGAAGTVASRDVMNADPDGHTVLFHHGMMQVASASGMADFTWKDFELSAIAGRETGSTLVVKADAPWKNLEDLQKALEEDPHSVDLTAVIGGTTYLVGKRFESAGMEFNLVDVGDSASRLAAVLGGNVDVSQNPFAQVKPYLDSGELRAIAALTDDRISAAPDLPTVAEQGVDAGFQYNYFFLFPKSTPESAVDRFASAVEAVVANPAYGEEIRAKYYQEPMALTGAAATERLEKLDSVIGSVSLK